MNHQVRVWRSAVVALAICVAGGPTASAQPAEAEPTTAADPPQVTSAAQAFELARAQFQQGEYETALATVETGLAIEAKNRRLLRLRGTIFLEKLDYEGALAAYEAFLDAGPRGVTRRKAKKIVDNLQIARTTFLKVRVENGPANVYLNRKQYGVWCRAAPECKRGIVPRGFRVYIERDGFVSKIERVAISAETTNELAVTLEELPSQLDIAVTPKNAQVTLNNNDELGAGDQSVTIPAGDHTVRVSLGGFVTAEERISAHLGKPVAVAVELTELLRVVLSVADAQLTLDGNPVALDNGALPVSPGPHTVVARAEGYRDAVVEIPAQRQPGYRVEITLQAEPVVVSSSNKEWTAAKIASVAATGTLAALGYGLAAVDGARANNRWDEAKTLCRERSGDGLLCNPDDLGPGEEARDTARRANIEFAAGTIAAVGGLMALNWRERAPLDGGFSLRRKISLGATVGVAALGLGTFAYYQLGQRSEQDRCNGDPMCLNDLAIARKKNQDDSQAAILGLAVAGSALGGAAYLWFTAPRREQLGDGRAVRLVPQMSGDRTGVLVMGTF
ncbi:MAG: PEGA domain-containing protein [Proteobacteria bacterium]|nr:PEGA domain-containing protein [Pseudomonadota bacterium]